MSEATSESKRVNWPDCCGFTKLFRSFKMAIHWPKVALAFLGIVLTYAAGEILDSMWASSCMPAVSSDGRMTEADVFNINGCKGVKEWTKGLGKPDKIQRIGPFDLLLKRICASASGVTMAVTSCSPAAIFSGLGTGFMAFAWLVAMHPGYAILFGGLSIIIWSLFGGALCRVAALHATRDERIGMGEALSFAKGRFLSFFFAPLMPVVVMMAIGVGLFLAGLIGLIPAIGEVLVGIFFFLALLAGFALAFVIIGAVGGYLGGQLFTPAFTSATAESTHFSSTALFFAAAGAAVFLAVGNMIYKLVHKP